METSGAFLYAKSALSSPVVKKAVSFPVRRSQDSTWFCLVVFGMASALKLSRFDDGQFSEQFTFPLYANLLDLNIIHNEITGTPDIVALVDSGHLLIFTFHELTDGLFQLALIQQEQISLKFSTPLEYTEATHRLAIDPKSRAFATFGYQYSLQLWTKSPRTGKFESTLSLAALFPSWQTSTIWCGEFIHSPVASLNKLLFAMIVQDSTQNGVSIVILELSPSDAGYTHSVLGPIPLSADFPRPLAILAMDRYPEAFLLITERSGFIVRRSDVMSGNVTLNEFRFPTSPPSPFESTLEVNKPLLCAFTRPLESHAHHNVEADSGDLFYVCTVDGHIQSLEASLTPGLIVTYLGKTVGSPVAIIPLLGDYLIAIPSFGDGALLKVNLLSGLFEQKALMSSSAPLVDSCMLDPFDEGFNTIFACCVNKPNVSGSLREIRQGVKVTVTSCSNSQEYEMVNGIWFCPSEASDNLVVLGMMENTIALRFNEGELEDVTRSADGMLPTDEEADLIPVAQGRTLAAGYLGRTFAQVTATALFDPQKNTSIWESTESVVSASFLGHYVFVAQSSKSFVVVDCSDGRLRSAVSMSTPDEITCISSFMFDNVAYCVIGTYSREVLIFKIDGGAASPVFQDQIDKYVAQSIGIPESLGFVRQGVSSFFLVGTRDGHLLSWEILLANGDMLFEKPSCLSVGILPVKLVPSVDSSYCLAFSDKSWKVIPKTSGILLSLLSFREKIDFACPCVLGAESDAASFLFISRGDLMIVSLEKSEQFVNAVPLTFHPRRIGAEHNGKNLVIHGLEQKGVTVKSSLRLYKPSSFFTTEYLLDEEQVYAIKNWETQFGSFMVVCTGVRISTGKTIGRVLLMPLGKSNGTLVSHRQEFSQAVSAIHPFSDSMLLVGSGKILYLCQLVSEKSLDVVSSFMMRWKITALCSRSFRFVVGCEREGITFLAFRPQTKQIEYIRSDAACADVQDCIFVSDDLVVVADRLGGVYGVSLESADDHGAIDSNLSHVFYYHLGELASRLSIGSITNHGNMKQSKRTEESQQSQMDSSISLETILDTSDSDFVPISQNVVVTSLVGGIHVLTPVLREHYHILQKLQTILEQQQHDSRSDFHMRFRSRNKPALNVIDGDYISRIFALGRTEQLVIIQKAIDAARPGYSKTRKQIWDTPEAVLNLISSLNLQSS